jgi:hypothetical protein
VVAGQKPTTKSGSSAEERKPNQADHACPRNHLGCAFHSTHQSCTDDCNQDDSQRCQKYAIEGAQAEVDGVVFAEIDNGDCFVFDISSKASEYPVYWHRHEENDLEAFAPSFAECIKRLSDKA